MRVDYVADSIGRARPDDPIFTIKPGQTTQSHH